VAQVDLGVRSHRSRPLDELGPAALAVLHEGLRRAGTPGMAWPAVLTRPGGGETVVGDGIRPPLADLPTVARDRG